MWRSIGVGFLWFLGVGLIVSFLWVDTPTLAAATPTVVGIVMGVRHHKKSPRPKRDEGVR